MENDVNGEFSVSQTPPVKSELELVQERIANYTVPVKPAVANVINAMLEQSFKTGVVKPAEIEAYMSVRDDISKGLADYQIQVNNANNRMQQLMQEDQQLKMQQQAQLEADRVAVVSQERQRRKEAEMSLAKMEAVLLSHGISMDLNGDGVVGLANGMTSVAPLTATEQAQVDSIVREQTPLASKPNRTGNAGLARAMNPAPETPVDSTRPIPLDTPQSHTVVPSPVATHSLREKVLQGPEDVALTHEPSVADLEAAPTVVTEDITDEDSDNYLHHDYEDTSPRRELTDAPIIAEGEDLDSFFDEVDKVEEELDGTYTDPTPTFETQSAGMTEREPTPAKVQTSAPVVTGGNAPNIKAVLSEPKTIDAPISESDVFNEQVETAKQSFAAWAEDNNDTVTEVESTAKQIPTYDSEEELLAAAQSRIDQQVQDDIDAEQFNASFEEETEEVTIPDRADLESMSKTDILAQAEMFNFDIPASISKGQMIDKFENETEAFIQQLQDSGEFVSSEDETNNDKDDVRDGGYF